MENIEEKFLNLLINEKDIQNIDTKKLGNCEIRELYKFASKFYKENEGKSFKLTYEDKLKLVAFKNQITHGNFLPEKAPELGDLDVIGQDRRLAWQALKDMSEREAMEGFVTLLAKIYPFSKSAIGAENRDNHKKGEDLNEEEDDEQRINSIKEMLNQRSYYTFKELAEKQCPGNPEQQSFYIKNLQDQHYQQYMKELMIKNEDFNEKNNFKNSKKLEDEWDDLSDNADENLENEEDREILIESKGQDWPPVARPEMWAKKDVEEFKEKMRREVSGSVIDVGNGQIVTFRVPTHEDGTTLFWEFATDGYDIGFGVYFAWEKATSKRVTIHINDQSEEEDFEDYDSAETTSDLEHGADEEFSVEDKPTTPISVIIPIDRKDSHVQVFSGSHQYPEQGVYLIKFDNTYSIWRSKRLYYNIYHAKTNSGEKF